MTDALIEAVRDHTTHLSLSLNTDTWEQFRAARATAIAQIGEPTRAYQGPEMGYLEWTVHGVSVKLWTPAYRRPQTDAKTPPDDFGDLMRFGPEFDDED